MTSTTPGIGSRAWLGMIVGAVVGGLFWSAIVLLILKMAGWW